MSPGSGAGIKASAILFAATEWCHTEMNADRAGEVEMAMKMFSTTIVALAMASSAMAQMNAAAQKKQDKLVHLNQIQVIGSHNSYHTGFAPSARKYLEQTNPKALRALDYSHPALDVQLTGGVRQLEIDVFVDTKGGRFAHLNIDDKIKAAGLPADPPFDPNHVMDKPGFKVMHVQGLDQRSSCQTFVACLTTVRAWSKAHPGHMPIFLLIETKEGEVKGLPDAPQTESFTPAIFDLLDAEIRSVFKPGEMITPDEVRGKHTTLNEAIKSDGWPTLEKARGRVVFLMDQRKVESIYTEGHPSLRGRILFTNAVEGAPDAAFIEENDGTKPVIDGLVKQGYLVRTRTDEGTEQARTNDTTRRDAALATGAQIISTDYPAAEPSSWTGYSVGLPGGMVARCNPLNAPAGCVDALLQDAGK